MQILPTSQTDGAYGFLGGNNAYASNDGNFMSAMLDAFNAVDNGEYVSATAALNDNDQPNLVESPYTRHTTDGVTYTLSEVCFSKNELNELRAQLLKEGAPEESLRQFDILADQPDGATLAQVIASLTGKSSINFSEDDAAAITALLGQIDPTGQLATDVLDFMRGGNAFGALNLIQNALGNLDASDRIDLDTESLTALGRGLGLNDGTMAAMLSQLGNRNSLTVNAAGLNALLNPAKSQIMTEAANAEKLNAALEKTLKPIISRARDRMEKEKAAGELRNRRVEQSRVLIDRTVQENARGTLDETMAGNDADGPQSGMVGHGGANGGNVGRKGEAAQSSSANQMETRDAANARNARADRHAAERDPAAGQHPGDNSGTGASDDGGKNLLFGDGNEKNAWSELLGKIETKPANVYPVANNFINTLLQGEFESGQIWGGQAVLETPQLARQLAGQVEQGLLTAMQDGSTRLDLQLHPAELGALTITLIARNGEVTAQIRSEKSETADMLNRQMDAIRITLEQQGVKVDKIDVQLQEARDDRQNLFPDLGQHNARQEHDARQQELARLRNLASLRNNNTNDEQSVLAQSVHDMAQQARYAGQAMHVVA